MKVEEIERLLAEFYEGNTNEQEEELLKEAFRTEEVPEHLQKDKKLFLSFFPGEVVDNVPAGLEDKLSRMIDEKAEEEQRFFHRNKAKRNWRWIGGIAATILVLVGVGYGITNMGEDMRPPTPQDTFSDPEAAYKALQATLIEVSANLNKGIEQIEETRIDVTKVNQEVRKEIGPCVDEPPFARVRDGRAVRHHDDVAFALPGTEEPIQQVWRYERRVVRLHIQGNDRNESQLVY